jgi:galactoside O-acetyltransferase
LEETGFKPLGENVLVSDRASIYNAENISIGNNVRIDDFVVLSAGEGGVAIGDYIHIGVYSSLIGRGRIELKNFANISSRVSIYSSNDDYSGLSMTNPMVPEEYKNVVHGNVIIEEHVIVASGSVILPNVTLHRGAGVGALSLVTCDVPPLTIVAGIPAKRVSYRSDNIFELEARLKIEQSLRS